MSNSKMLIDASHPEETRVVVLKGNRVEEFDFEAANKRQLRGNIYLAKVTRVEPSLQAAFVEYGGNRHGFLAFSEIHPDYYQIPFADRQALLEEEARAHRDEDEEGRGERHDRGGRGERGSRGERSEQGDRGPRAERGDQGERGPRPERSEQGERSERGDRNHRRSRRHRRDGAVSAMDRRGPADDSVSEPAFASSEHEEPVAAVGFDHDGAVETETGALHEPTDRAAGDGPEGAVSQAGDDQRPEAFSAGPQSGAMPTFYGANEDAPAEPSAAQDEPAAEAHDATSRSASDLDLIVSTEPGSIEPPASQADLIMAGLADEEKAEAGHSVEPADQERPLAGSSDAVAEQAQADDAPRSEAVETEARRPDGEDGHEDEHVEQIGGDALEDVSPRPARLRRHYKIQEVIKRRQILLIQVVKEERGNKGAALTTYLSLAGRYSVLMPNTARGGGISRKITDGEDRRRLKAIAQELDVPEGMGVILRTAGAARSPIEVRRDFEYLLRMWESVRELTLKSTAPTLVYEEGSLIKRSIRDLYGKEVEDIVVAGEDGFSEARDFMRMLMPNNVKSVQLYRDPQPIFAKSGVEAQLDAMFSNHVTLKSGGYLVINQTEALVAIDVNSGRSTREHNIEDTALRTNLEAADEVARQLRLRDLAGLIVVDFIDMEEGRNNRAVERRIKDALKNDRARIQIGRISHFGLLEMSRQRIRTGVLEGSTVVCAHCAGAGTVRSTASIALHVLRLLEDALIKDATHDLVVRSRSEVALYVLNQKRAKLVELEQRFGITITVTADPTLTGMIYHAIERGELATPTVAPAPRRDLVRVDSIAPIFEPESDVAEDESVEASESEDGDSAEGDAASTDLGDGNRKRRRRRRRRGRDRDGGGEMSADAPQPSDEGLGTMAEIGGDLDPDTAMVAVDAVAFETDGPEAADVVEAPAFDDVSANPSASMTADEAPEVLAAEAMPVAEISDVAEEAPRPRRTRRTTRKDADASVAAESAEPDAVTPAPRRRRPSRARAVEVTPELSLDPVAVDEADSMARPSADRDVGADTVEHHAPLAPPDTAIPPAAAVPETPAPLPEAAPVAAEPPRPTEVEDPNRPKRSGWWQRAKASFGS